MNLKYRVFFWFIFVAIVLSKNAWSVIWNINDVSILMAIPANVNEVSLLALNSSGVGGELFPQRLYTSIGVLSVPSAAESKSYQNLHAVSFRFDPCPPSIAVTSKCEPELRIVWQPVMYDVSAQTWTTDDAALHTFYHLNPQQFQNIIHGLKDIKIWAEQLGVTTAQKSLFIHPAELHQKTRKIFETKLYQLILSNVGMSNLFKFTAMKLLVPQNWWKFVAGMEKKNNQWVPATIASHGGREMDLINDATHIDPQTGLVQEIDASIFILRNVARDADIRNIVSTAFRKTFSMNKPMKEDLTPFKITIDALNKFQNPHLSNPHTIDCVSCHYADAARDYATKVFPEIADYGNGLQTYYGNFMPAVYNNSNNTIVHKTSKVLRAFGYLGRTPSVMTRTINDSIEAAHWLNEHEK